MRRKTLAFSLMEMPMESIYLCRCPYGVKKGEGEGEG